MVTGENTVFPSPTARANLLVIKLLQQGVVCSMLPTVYFFVAIKYRILLLSRRTVYHTLLLVNTVLKFNAMIISVKGMFTK